MPSTDEHLIERRKTTEVLFEGHFLRAVRDTVALPSGDAATREYVVHPGAVVVVALLANGNVVLERQFRYPVGQVLVEFPAGKLNPGEDPLACGQRELREETGYVAREWAYAGLMHLAVAYSTEVIHVYFARGLVLGERQLDAGEFLEVFDAPPDELLRWARGGKVTDAKTLSCALWMQNFVAGQWRLKWNSVSSGKEGGPHEGA